VAIEAAVFLLPLLGPSDGSILRLASSGHDTLFLLICIDTSKPETLFESFVDLLDNFFSLITSGNIIFVSICFCQDGTMFRWTIL